EGQEFDPDLGLLNLRRRQYHAGRGRFLTLDPLPGKALTPMSLNRYLLADGDPVNLWDPTGSQISLTLPLLANIATKFVTIAIIAIDTDVLAHKLIETIR